jgi:hypothetical protein
VSDKPNGKPATDEQAVIVWIRLANDDSGSPEELEHCFKVEEEVLRAVEDSGAGEYDGNEIGGGFFKLYAYGPSAERLWDIIVPVLKQFQIPSGSYVIKRYGGPGSKQDRTILQVSSAQVS